MRRRTGVLETVEKFTMNPPLPSSGSFLHGPALGRPGTIYRVEPSMSTVEDGRTWADSFGNLPPHFLLKSNGSGPSFRFPLVPGTSH